MRILDYQGGRSSECDCGGSEEGDEETNNRIGLFKVVSDCNASSMVDDDRLGIMKEEEEVAPHHSKYSSQTLDKGIRKYEGDDNSGIESYVSDGERCIEKLRFGYVPPPQVECRVFDNEEPINSPPNVVISSVMTTTHPAAAPTTITSEQLCTKLFHQVEKNLDINQMVLWKHGPDSLKAVLDWGEHPECMSFLQNCFSKIVSIMLDQVPGKLGEFERQCLEGTLEHSINIILWLLRRGGEMSSTLGLSVLCMILCQSKNYYQNPHQHHCASSYSMRGCESETRKGLMDQFVGGGGLPLIVKVLSNSAWQGSENMYLILAALLDCDTRDHEADVKQLVSNIIKDMLNLMEEDMKMEPTESMNDIVECMHNLAYNWGQKWVARVYSFALGLALKYMESSSLPLRLIGWDMVPSLIELAVVDRPPARAYRVSGAGCPVANGLFVYAGMHGNVPKYRNVFKPSVSSGKQENPAERATLEATILSKATAECDEETNDNAAAGSCCTTATDIDHSCGSNGVVARRHDDIGIIQQCKEPPEDVVELTLFQCKMQTGVKCWFISEADKESPGTDKDVDYYQNKGYGQSVRSSPEPPLQGWISCSTTGGYDPPPKLEKLGPLVDPGREEDDTLEHKLVRWVSENKVVMAVFGDSIHREVVNRSAKLLQFLCETQVEEGRLTKSDIDIVWNSCLGSAEAELQEEIYSLLSMLVVTAPPNLIVHLFECLRRSAEGEAFFQVVAFMQVLQEKYDVMSSLVATPTLLSTTLDLLWTLQKPAIAQLKSHVVLAKLFSHLLQASSSYCDPSTLQSHRCRYLLECLQKIRVTCSSSVILTEAEEAETLWALQLVKFLLDAFPPSQRVAAIDELSFLSDGPVSVLDCKGDAVIERLSIPIPELLLQEIRAYHERFSERVGRQHVRMQDAANLLKTELFHRLMILRYVNGISPNIKLNRNQLESLFTLLSTPGERESFIAFIENGAVKFNNPFSWTGGGPVESSGAGSGAVRQEQDDAPVWQQQRQCSSTFHSKLHPAFTTETLFSVFRDLVCKKTDWTSVGPHTYQCFVGLLEQVRKCRRLTNNAANTTSLECGGDESMGEELEMEMLWKIALLAQDPKVASMANVDLIEAYASANAGSHKPFLAIVYQRLSQVRDEIASHNNVSPPVVVVETADSDFGSVTDGLHSRVQRLIHLLQESITQMDGSLLSPSHGQRGEGRVGGASFSVKVVPTSCGGEYMGGIQSSISCAPVVQQNPLERLDHIKLVVHPMETIHSVRRRTARKLGLDASHDVIRLSFDAKPLEDVATIQSLNIIEGCELAIWVVPRLQHENSSLQNWGNSAHDSSAMPFVAAAASAVSAADAIDEYEQYCHILLDILGMLKWEDEKDMAVARDIWGLLMSVPTDKALLLRVQQAGLETAKKNIWNELLSAGHNCYKMVYVLQIVDFLLTPASLRRRNQDWLCSSSEFKAGFLRSGGLEVVLSKVTSSSSSNRETTRREDAVLAHTVALHILWLCLFEGEDQKEEEQKMVGVLSQRISGHPVCNLKTLLEAQIDLPELLERIVKLSWVAQRLITQDSSVCSFIQSDVLLKQTFLNALFAIESIIQSQPETASALVHGPNTKAWVMSILLENPTQVVRQAMSRLVVNLPFLHSPAISWLTEELVGLAPESTQCAEFFDTLEGLVTTGGCYIPTTSVKALSTVLSTKLLLLLDWIEPGGGMSGGDDVGMMNTTTRAEDKLGKEGRIGENEDVFCGCLSLLRRMLEDGSVWRTAILSSELGRGLIPIIFDKFLFSMSPLSLIGKGKGSSLCSTPRSRCASFKVLALASQLSIHMMRKVLDHVNSILLLSRPNLLGQWVSERNYELKRGSTEFVGLKNQGCTCYMNSLLQNLFMIPCLRRAVLSAPLPPQPIELPINPADWVGMQFRIRWEGGGGVKQLFRDAVVIDYDPATGRHKIQYSGSDVVMLNLREGRAGKETGLFAVLTAAATTQTQQQDGSSSSPKASKTANGVVANCGDLSPEVHEVENEGYFPPHLVPLPSNEIELNSSTSNMSVEVEDKRHLLEQIQRTFCYMMHGMMRYFDPRPFVEACRCLNLQYSVYQQNDASEFCATLLDHLEQAVKGKSPAEKMLAKCFGGSLLNVKTPKGCSHRTVRKEPFINLELIIRGKGSIQNSLSALAEGELMQGENRVVCEDCGEKKDAIRRTCLGTLPNLLIIHLKRFDLDYTTFETVKLTDHCDFPLDLDMEPYTFEGIERRDELETLLKNQGGVLTLEQKKQFNMDLEVKNRYMYHLKGVLVHAGVAQGGHYYSFIRDRREESDDVDRSDEGKEEATTPPPSGMMGKERWLRFDDEDVTLFDPKDIDVHQSFDGVTNTNENNWNNVFRPIEQECAGNALLLFYEKEEQQHLEDEAPKKDNKAPQDVVMGNEVLQHIGDSCTSLIQEEAMLSSIDDDEEEAIPGLSVVQGRSASSYGGEDEMWQAAEQINEFMNEVLLSNTQFLIRSYVFDAEFHKFLRNFIEISLNNTFVKRCNHNHNNPCEYSSTSFVEISSLVESKEAAVGSISLPDAKRQVIDVQQGRVCCDEEGGDGVTLRRDVLCMGVAAFFNVVLHSREQARKAKHWVELINAVFSKEPAVCGWMVTEMVIQGWLRQYIFKCTDPNARIIACQLMVRAICSHAKDEDELLRIHQATASVEEVQEAKTNSTCSHHEIKKHPSTTGHYSNPNKNDNCSSTGTVLDALEEVISFLDEIPVHCAGAEELFSLICGLAMGDENVRLYFLKRNVVAHLVYFVTRERSHPDVIMQFQSLSVNSDSDRLGGGHSMFLGVLNLLESIGGLLGMRLFCKEDLLLSDQLPSSPPDRIETPSTGSMSGSGQVISQQCDLLTPSAKAALEKIFCRFSDNHSMGMSEIQVYMNAIAARTGQQQHLQDVSSSTTNTIRTFLNKYSTLPDGRISLNDFLNYYLDISQNSPKRVWSDIIAVGGGYEGMGHHLQEAGGIKGEIDYDENVRTPSYKVGGGEGSSWAQQHSQHSPFMCHEKPCELPQLTRKALSELCFYDYSFDQQGEIATWILTCICWCDTNNSINLICECLDKLTGTATNMDGWGHHHHATPGVDTPQSVLTAMLAIEDNIQIFRIQTALNNKCGGLFDMMLKQDQQQPEHQANNTHAATPGSRGMIQRCLIVLQGLMVIPAVSQYVHRNLNSEYNWIITALSITTEGGSDAGGGEDSIFRSMGGMRRRRILEQHCDDDNADGMLPHYHILKRGRSDLSQCNQQQQPQSPPCESVADSSDQVEFIVSEAGSLKVNGIYQLCTERFIFDKCNDNGGVECYEKITDGERQQQKFIMYKCQLNNNKQKQWFISEVHTSLLAGTQQQVTDYYFSECRCDEEEECSSRRSLYSIDAFNPTQGCYPPQSGWCIIGNGQSPAPIVLFRFSKEEDCEDDDVWMMI